MIPSSDHNEALTGDTLYSVFLNHEWREIVVAAVIERMTYLASTITDENDLQEFEVRYGALIDDFYNEEILDTMPLGSVMWYVGRDTTVPAKWLIASGQSLDIGDYADLADIVHASWIVGSDIILPDLREQFLYGAETNTDLGDTGGAADHVLTVAEMPSHSHVQRGRNSSGGANLQSALATGADATQLTAFTSTATSGSGNAHNNMPPYVRGYWIIKVLP